MTPAADIDRPSSSWFRLTFGSASRVSAAQGGSEVAEARTSEGITPPAGETGRRRLS